LKSLCFINFVNFISKYVNILQLYKIFKLQYNMDIINIPFSWGGYTKITNVIYKLYDSQYYDISIRTTRLTLIYQRATHSMLRWIFVAYGSVNLIARPQWYTAKHKCYQPRWCRTRCDQRHVLSGTSSSGCQTGTFSDGGSFKLGRWRRLAPWLPAATGYDADLSYWCIVMVAMVATERRGKAIKISRSIDTVCTSNYSVIICIS
jgi:hypothetical protein